MHVSNIGNNCLFLTKLMSYNMISSDNIIIVAYIMTLYIYLVMLCTPSKKNSEMLSFPLIKQGRYIYGVIIQHVTRLTRGQAGLGGRAGWV